MSKFLGTNANRCNIPIPRQIESVKIRMLKRSFVKPRLEPILLLAASLGPFPHVVGRYAMDPDGMSYLDLGQSFFRRTGPMQSMPIGVPCILDYGALLGV